MRPFPPRRGEISVVLNFTKMEGCGNDYIYVDCLAGLSFDPAAAAVALSPRHFAVGADGLICICHSDVADAKMRMFNADGSEGSMCGNGVRCVAQWLFEHGLVKDEARVETAPRCLSGGVPAPALSVRRDPRVRRCKATCVDGHLIEIFCREDERASLM